MAEQLVVNPELNPESQEYIDAMAAKGEAAVNGGVPPEKPEEIQAKPEGIPDKFYNPVTGEVDYQSLAKSYVELEKSKNKPVEKPVDTPKDNSKSETTDDVANKAVSDAGLDMQSLSAQYAEEGELSQDSYDKLAKAGIPKEMVDSYIDGQTAKVEVMRTQAYSITEGAEGYKAMIEWAKVNGSPTDVQAYNAAINSPVAGVRELAVRDMWSKYGADTGNTGSLITGKTNSKVSSGAYESRAQMMTDMADPKYKTDPAFRAKVEGKLANSNIF
jgi:hypothetical protein